MSTSVHYIETILVSPAKSRQHLLDVFPGDALLIMAAEPSETDPPTMSYCSQNFPSQIELCW